MFEKLVKTDISSRMFAIIFFALFVLFANEGKALKAESICCEEIESLLNNKTTAYQTVCLGRESRLSRNCCRNIETEIEKHRYAYKTLCPIVAKPVTTPTTPPSTTTAITTSPSTGMLVFHGFFSTLLKKIMDEFIPFASH